MLRCCKIPLFQGLLSLQWMVPIAFGMLTGFTPSHGASVESLDWAELSHYEISQELEARFTSDENLFNPKVSFSSLEIALSDSDSLLSPEFRVPKDLRGAARFWLRIYTEFTTRHVVIFDSRHPDIVYEVLDFRELAKTARGPITYELTARKRVSQAVANYEKAFRHLAKRPFSEKLPNGRDREIKNIRKALAKAKHKHSYSDLIKNLRTQTGQRDNVIRGLTAAEAFLPKMEEIFRDLGVPVELTRLALVESSFNLRAMSRVGAAGVWQFMPGPGSKFMLIDKKGAIDERLSPLKSTVAAARLLKETYHRFKSWPLTVTAYNHGLRGLIHIKKEKSQNFDQIAHLFDPCKPDSPLGWAGRNYYAEFLALLHAETYRKLFYGEPPARQLGPIHYRTLGRPTYPVAIAKTMKISMDRFRSLNPDVRNISRPLPKGFLYAVPSSAEDLSGLTKVIRRKTKAPTKVALSKSARKRVKPTKT